MDLDARTVSLEDGASVDYDYLIVATGATHSYFGKDEWADVAPGLKTVEDALNIRARILEAFEHAEKSPEDSAKWLTFVVVGAGPTGVELAGALVEIAVHGMGSEFDVIEPAESRVVLVEGTDRVLPPYPESLSASARRQLEEIGVEVRTDALVSEIDDNGVTLNSGEAIPAGTVLWAAGVQASGIGAELGGRDGPSRKGPG